jgi:transposase
MMDFVGTLFVSTKEIVHTLANTHSIETPGRKNRWRTKAERRAIVEETLLPGASVSRVARRHDVNANQVFRWRKLYHQGHLGEATGFLPVMVAKELSREAGKQDDLIPSSGILEIKLAKGALRISGSVDVILLRAVIEALV